MEQLTIAQNDEVIRTRAASGISFEANAGKHIAQTTAQEDSTALVSDNQEVKVSHYIPKTDWTKQWESDGRAVEADVNAGLTIEDIEDKYGSGIFSNTFALPHLARAKSKRTGEDAAFPVVRDTIAFSRIASEMHTECGGDLSLLGEDKKKAVVAMFLRAKGFPIRDYTQIDKELKTGALKNKSLDEATTWVFDSYLGEQVKYNRLAEYSRLLDTDKERFLAENGYKDATDLFVQNAPKEMGKNILALQKANPRERSAAVQIAAKMRETSSLGEWFKTTYQQRIAEQLNAFSPDAQVRILALVESMNPEYDSWFGAELAGRVLESMGDTWNGVANFIEDATVRLMTTDEEFNAGKEWYAREMATRSAVLNSIRTKYTERGAVGSILMDTGVAFADTFSIMALGWATGGAGAVAGTIGWFGLGSAGNTYTDLLSRGVDPNTAFYSSLEIGAVEAGSEYLQAVIPLGKGVANFVVGKGAKSMALNMLSKDYFYKVASGEVAATTKAALTRAAGRAALGMAEETGTELVSVGNKALVYDSLGVSIDGEFFGEVTDTVKTMPGVFLLGALTGTGAAKIKNRGKIPSVTQLGMELDLAKMETERQKAQAIRLAGQMLDMRFNQDSNSVRIRGIDDRVSEIDFDLWGDMSVSERKQELEAKFFRGEKHNDADMEKALELFDFINKAGSTTAESATATAAANAPTGKDENAEAEGLSKTVSAGTTEEIAPESSPEASREALQDFVEHMPIWQELEAVAPDMNIATDLSAAFGYNVEPAHPDVAEALKKLFERGDTDATLVQILNEYAKTAIAQAKLSAPANKHANPLALLVEKSNAFGDIGGHTGERIIEPLQGEEHAGTTIPHSALDDIPSSGKYFDTLAKASSANVAHIEALNNSEQSLAKARREVKSVLSQKKKISQISETGKALLRATMQFDGNPRALADWMSAFASGARKAIKSGDKPSVQALEDAAFTFAGRDNPHVEDYESLRVNADEGSLSEAENNLVRSVSRLNALTNGNVKIVFFDSSALDANGFIDKDNIIHINRNSREPLLKTFGHEFTHYLEASKGFASLKKYILAPEGICVRLFLEQYGGRHLTLESYAQAMKDLYERETGKTFSAEAIEREILADVCGAVLFTNHLDAIFKIRKQNENFFEKCLDFLKKLFSATRGTKISRDITDAIERYRAVALEQRVAEESDTTTTTESPAPVAPESEGKKQDTDTKRKQPSEEAKPQSETGAPKREQSKPEHKVAVDLLNTLSAKRDLNGIFMAYAEEAGVKYPFPSQYPSFRTILELVSKKRGVPIGSVIAEAEGAIAFASKHAPQTSTSTTTEIKPNEFEALTPSAENPVRIKGHYRVVDLSELQFVDVSDKAQQDEQERNRSGRRTEEQVQRMLMSFESERLADDRHTDRGAPMYREVGDGIRSVSGEGRSRLLKKVYELGGVPEAQYRAHVEKFARERGIEIPAHIKQPVLLRIATDSGGLTWAQLAKASNTDMKSVYSTAEEAHADARELPKILNLLSARSDEGVLDEKNYAFVAAFNEAIGAGTQYTEDRKGGFKETIGLRIENALTAYVINDREAATDLFDSPISLGRVLSTLRKLSVDLVRLKDNEKYDIAPELSAALKAALHVRDQKERGNKTEQAKLIELYFEQNTFDFEKNVREGIDLGAAKILSNLMLDRKTSRFGETLSNYITEVEAVNGIDGSDIGLFAGTQDWGKKSDLMQTALNKATGNRFSLSQIAEFDSERSNIERDAKANGTWPSNLIRWSLSQVDLPGMEAAGLPLFEAIAQEKPEAKPIIDEVKKELLKRVAFDAFRRKPDEHKTIQDIKYTFGLLDIKIGKRRGKKWVTEDEVYDALLDLAEVADIPPASIGLCGRIRIDVSGRATTRVGGTYSPRDKNIMLYYRGSLAHEWMHALDNYFGGRFNGMRSNVNTYNNEPVRSEVFDAFENLKIVIRKAKFAVRSQKERSAYWTTDHEMLARAFEIYAFTKAQYDEEVSKKVYKEAEALLDEYQRQRRAGKRFSFEEIDELRSRQKMLLENSERLRHFLTTDRDSDVRPSKEELESDGIGAAFDKLFGTLQWVQQGRNVRLYSLSHTTQNGEVLTFESMRELIQPELPFTVEPQGKAKATPETREPERFLRKLQPGEFCKVERMLSETKWFDFMGAEKIESIDDVAYIFRGLEHEASEHAFAVLVDAQGKPTVLHLGTGVFDATQYNAKAIAGLVAKIKPKQLYFIHNHPSGSLVASNADLRVLESLKRSYPDIMQPGIIINLKSGKYLIFGDEYSKAESQKPKNEFPVKVLRFDRQVFAPDYDPEKEFHIGGHEDVAKFLSGHRLGSRGKINVLILNTRNQVVGNAFTQFSALTRETCKDVADEIIYLVTAMGGMSAIVYGDFELQGNRYLDVLTKIVQAKDFRLLDFIRINGNHSAGERHVLSAQNEMLINTSPWTENFMNMRFSLSMLDDAESFNVLLEKAKFYKPRKKQEASSARLHDINKQSRRMIQKFIREHNELYSDPKQIRKLKVCGIALAKVLLQRKLENAPQNLVDEICKDAPTILKNDVKARGEMLARLMRENLDNNQAVKATIEDIAAMSNRIGRMRAYARLASMMNFGSAEAYDALDALMRERQAKEAMAEAFDIDKAKLEEIEVGQRLSAIGMSKDLSDDAEEKRRRLDERLAEMEEAESEGGENKTRGKRKDDEDEGDEEDVPPEAQRSSLKNLKDTPRDVARSVVQLVLDTIFGKGKIQAARLAADLRRIGATDEQRGVLVKTLRKTATKTLMDAMHENVPVESRSRIGVVIGKLSAESNPGQIMKLLENGFNLVVMSSTKATRAQAYQKINRLLKPFARMKSRESNLNRRVDGEREEFLHECYKAWTQYHSMAKAAKRMEDIRSELIALGAETEPSENDFAKRRKLETELHALSLVGGARVKSVIDLLQVAWELEHGIEDDRKAHEEHVKAIRERNAIAYKEISEAAKARKPVLDRKQGKLEQLFTGVESFRQRLEGLIRFSDGKIEERARSRIEQMDRDLAQAAYRKESLAYVRIHALRDALEKIFGKEIATKLKNWHKHDEALAVFSRDGKTPLTLAQVANIYAQVRQEHYAAPLKERDAFDADRIELIERRISQIPSMERALGEKGVAVVDALCGLLRDIQPELRSTFKKVTGYEFFTEENYFPIQRQGARGVGIGLKGINLSALPLRFSTRIVSAVDITEDSSIFDVFDDASGASEHFIAYSQAHLFWQQAFADPEFSDVIRKHHGKAVLNDFREHVTNILSPEQLDYGNFEVVNKLTSLAAITALGGNTLVMLRQITGLPAFMFNMGTVDFGKYLAGTLTVEGWDAIREIIRNNPWFKTRTGRAFDSELRAMTKGEGAFSASKARALAWYMITNNLGDAVPILFVGQGIFRATYEACLRKGMSTSQAKEVAHAEVARHAESSQQSNRVMNMSAFNRKSSSIARAIQQFKSTTQQFLSYEVRAISDVMARPTDAARWARLGKVILLNHIILPGAYSATTMLFDLLIGGDMDEWSDEWFAKFVMPMLLGPASGIFFVGDALTTIGGGLSRGLPAAEILSKGRRLWRAGTAMFDDDTDKALDETFKFFIENIPPLRHAYELYKNRT